MALEVKQEKSYPHPARAVFEAAVGAVEGLEGKIAEQDSTNNSLEARFDKRILGNTLGERTYLSVKIGDSPQGCQVKLEAYPLDAVGRKLLFGARKGVTDTVVNWFFAHLEHRLPQS